MIHGILEVGIAYIARTTEEVVGSSTQIHRFKRDITRYGKIAIDIDLALTTGLAIGDGVPVAIGEGRLTDGERLLIAPMSGADSIARIRNTGTEEDATVGASREAGAKIAVLGAGYRVAEGETIEPGAMCEAQK